MKNNLPDVLIVDDDDEFRDLLLQRLTRTGFPTEAASNGAQALQLIQRQHFDVVVSDMNMPGMSGLELLEKLKTLDVDSEVMLLTGKGTIESAVQAMQLGAFNYLQKPFGMPELEAQIKKAAERGELRKENEQLKTLLSRKQKGTKIIGESHAMKEILHLIERAGPSDRAILIQGESGTGKELVAEALHQASRRADRPLVAVNCAALPETLLESELFGHERGAFTGAVATKQGLFEVANSGTLFIDEIGEMPGSLQAKLLRVLENGTLRRVGATQERKVDVRILAATNRNLRDEIKAGRFREDLYYRINVMSLELPPLREREGDIELLVDRFLGDDWHIEEDALQALMRYSWPGNVRQLINVLERAKILADDDVIQLKQLPKEVLLGEHGAAPTTSTGTVPAAPDDLDSFQRQKVLGVLQRENFNKARAARALGISRRKLYRLLERYGLGDSGSDQPKS